MAAAARQRYHQGRRGTVVRHRRSTAVLHDRARRRCAHRRRMSCRLPTCAENRSAISRASTTPTPRRSSATRIDGYEQFLAVYPNSPYAPRVAAMVAVRREEIIWRRAVLADTPPAYWSYLRRYPGRPARLGCTAAPGTCSPPAAEPPPDFAYYDFGVPPPPPDELGYFHEPVFMFVGPRFAPPPPPPLFFLPPRPREFAVLPPPPPPRERFGLPLPAASVAPAFVRPPRSVVMRPAVGVPGPAGRPETRVSLPAAIEQHRAPLAPGVRPVPRRSRFRHRRTADRADLHRHRRRPRVHLCDPRHRRRHCLMDSASQAH